MKLSKWDYQLLESIKNGADIYGYQDAKRLRELEKLDYVKIVKALMPPKDGAKQQPYFGAIAKVIKNDKNRRTSDARKEGRNDYSNLFYCEHCFIVLWRNSFWHRNCIGLKRVAK